MLMQSFSDTGDTLLLENKILRKRIACHCGYKGKSLFKKCPKCKKKTNVQFHDKQKLYPSYSGKVNNVIENENLVKLNLTVHAYSKENDLEFEHFQKDYSIITYLDTGKTEVESSDKSFEDSDSLLNLYVRGGINCLLRETDFFKEHFRFLLEKRGISHLPEKFQYKPLTVYKLLEFPSLQYFSWVENDKYTSVFFEELYGEKLKNAKTYEEALEVFLNRKTTKEIRRLATNPEQLEALILFSPFIKNNDLLKQIANCFKESIIQDPFGWFVSKEVSLFFEKAIKEIKMFHRDEKVFVKRLIKYAHDLALNSKEPRIVFSDFMHNMVDIGRMIERIKNKLPDYKFSFNGSILDFHDLLAKEYARLKHENFTISYSEKEKLLEKKDEKYEFLLPKSTHDLIDIGNVLDICVGSYDNKALAKQSIIVNMLKDKTSVACIEIENNRIIQAKTKRNGFPDGEIRKKILDWAKKNNLETKNCYDLNKAQ
jgi:hypothetical protein